MPGTYSPEAAIPIWVGRPVMKCAAGYQASWNPNAADPGIENGCMGVTSLPQLGSRLTPRRPAITSSAGPTAAPAAEGASDASASTDSAPASSSGLRPGRFSAGAFSADADDDD